MIAGYSSAQLKIPTNVGTIPDPFVANLQAATITKSKHYRGHIASFSECSDDSTPAFEMFCCRENLGGNQYFNSNVQRVRDAYNFGRHDIGIYPHIDSYEQQVINITAARDGNVPTTGAYKNGSDYYKLNLIPLVLMVRNTIQESRGNKEENYEPGITDVDWSSRASTISFPEYCQQKNGTEPGYQFVSGTNAQGYAKLDIIVPEVIINGAYYSNWQHAEWFYADYARDYFAWLNTKIGSADVFRGSVTSIVEYYWVREAVDSVSGNGNIITVNYSKKYPGSPYQSITTPLWIKVDLSATNYAGKLITTSHGGKIRNMGGNVYYISVNLDFNNTSLSFTITPSDVSNYINLTKPNISIVGNNVTSNLPVKIVVYRKLKAEYEKDVVSFERKHTFSTSHTLTLSRNTATYDYFLAAITQEGISNVTTTGIN